MNLDLHMHQGIKRIIQTAGRFYMNSHEGRLFLARMLPLIKKGANTRKGYEKKGTHIPPFLIASIASQCNLSCAGCYAQAGGACNSQPLAEELSGSQWESIFNEAADLGVVFILLAGGEPFTRRDVLEAAAQNKKIIFPVFTNGTMLSADYLSLMDENRNLVPVLSIEGEESETDKRRGEGIYEKVNKGMANLQERGILFGLSVTVTKENIDIVTTPSFIQKLRNKGCGLLFFVEYVPVSGDTEHLVLDQADVSQLEKATLQIREEISDMIILSFPGDEAAMGGCLASGRGFFHINASGGAEPCPFSPHSKQNLKTSTMLEVLASDYFKDLREIAKNVGEHQGGCTLFKAKEQVLALKDTTINIKYDINDQAFCDEAFHPQPDGLTGF